MSLKTVYYKDIKIRLPSGIIISGPSGSGKTSFLMQLLQHAEDFITPEPKAILYCYAQYNKHIPMLERAGIICCAGIPDDELIASLPRPLLIILDDLMGAVSEKYISDMFTRRAHHEGFSIIFIVQNLFEKHIRVARFNAQYLILMRQPNSMMNVRNIAQQLFPRNMGYFMAAYNDATAQPFGYLMIDLHAASNPVLRLRTNILPGEEDPTIYLPRNV